MKVNNYELSEEEENKFVTIYKYIQNYFPNIKYYNQNTILGIGEPNKCFMCYLIVVENALYIKFKQENSYIPFNLKLKPYVDAVCEHFYNNDCSYTINETPKPILKRRRVVKLFNTVVVYVKDIGKLVFTILPVYIITSPTWNYDRYGNFLSDVSILSNANFLEDGTISENAPIAKAVMGKHRKDYFKYEVHDVTFTGKILDIFNVEQNEKE